MICMSQWHINCFCYLSLRGIVPWITFGRLELLIFCCTSGSWNGRLMHGCPLLKQGSFIIQSDWLVMCSSTGFEKGCFLGEIEIFCQFHWHVTCCCRIFRSSNAEFDASEGLKIRRIMDYEASWSLAEILQFRPKVALPPPSGNGNVAASRIIE